MKGDIPQAAFKVLTREDVRVRTHSREFVWTPHFDYQAYKRRWDAKNRTKKRGARA